MEQQNLLNNDLQVDAGITMHLKETASWARFLGIMGFVMSGLIAIIAFILPSYISGQYSPYERYGARLDSSALVQITVIYLIIAGISFMVAMFTYKFGNKIKLALQTNDQVSLDDGMKNLKFLFRFYGVIAIISLAFFILGILGVALVGTMR